MRKSTMNTATAALTVRPVELYWRYCGAAANAFPSSVIALFWYSSLYVFHGYQAYRSTRGCLSSIGIASLKNLRTVCASLLLDPIQPNSVIQIGNPHCEAHLTAPSS